MLTIENYENAENILLSICHFESYKTNKKYATDNSQILNAFHYVVLKIFKKSLSIKTIRRKIFGIRIPTILFFLSSNFDKLKILRRPSCTVSVGNKEKLIMR